MRLVVKNKIRTRSSAGRHAKDQASAEEGAIAMDAHTHPIFAPDSVNRSYWRRDRPPTRRGHEQERGVCQNSSPRDGAIARGCKPRSRRSASSQVATLAVSRSAAREKSQQWRVAVSRVGFLLAESPCERGLSRRCLPRRAYSSGATTLIASTR